MRDSILTIKDTLELVIQSKPIQTTSKVVHSEPNRDLLDYIDVFGGIGSSILIFFLGLFLSNLISKRKDKRKDKEYYNFFQTYLKEQKTVNLEQIECINSQLKELSEHNSLKTLETVVQPFYLYDSLDKIKLLSSYQTLKINTSQLIDELGQIELTRNIINTLNEACSDHLVKQETLRNEWSSIVQRFDSSFPVINKNCNMN